MTLQDKKAFEGFEVGSSVCQLLKYTSVKFCVYVFEVHKLKHVLRISLRFNVHKFAATTRQFRRAGNTILWQAWEIDRAAEGETMKCVHNVEA